MRVSPDPQCLAKELLSLRIVAHLLVLTSEIAEDGCCVSIPVIGKLPNGYPKKI
jgi:hypothetical protein